MQKPIGGYFEWEFPRTENLDLYPNAVLVNSGRHALEYILRGLGDVKCLWVPYFTCDVVLQPLSRLGIPHAFYHLNSDLELPQKINLEQGEYLLYTNYYGIKDAYISELSAIYGGNLIIDNAQALFCRANEASHQIYSPRKFLGMPDGGVAVTSVPNTIETLPVDNSYDRCSHLLKRMELLPSEGYDDFKTNSRKIAEASLGQMSPISKCIFKSVDLALVKKIRRDNFSFLHDVLGNENAMQIPSMESFECPLIYPFWTNNPLLKKFLISKNVFVATYWPNVFDWVEPNEVEYDIAEHVVCIPVDQRYTKDDMKYIIDCISRFKEGLV